MNAALNHRDPLVFDTRELGRRPGALKRVSRTVDAPASLGIEVIGVPEGAPVELELRLESVMEGVLVTGTAEVPLEGECVRCLEPVSRTGEADFQELFSYPDAESRYRRAAPADDVEESEESETYVLEADLFDLEPVLRDAVVLSLPLQPVCREDCPGLCPACGFRLADDPEHHHDEAVDIRWAALQELAGTMRPGGRDADQEKPPRTRGDEPQEK
ncbi:YceD family protein [Streptomyces sp. ACA25]|uniref:YceD family protein n=1 Tax=Streptomyces sp. ACA25 TaxID=3022596 RepID=UPI002307A6EA|nr:YceD family protein [Streptomyces sp. ACA25]MDB1089624.1 YceD family protein [Streptomyces sp. ACA25]